MKIKLEDFKPANSGECLSMCKKIPIKTESGLTVVCLGCKRVILKRGR